MRNAYENARATAEIRIRRLACNTRAVHYWQITLDDSDETARWVYGSPLDLIQLRDMAIKEARAAGCEGVVVKSHIGTVLFCGAHGQSVEHPKNLERHLIPLELEPNFQEQLECDNRTCRQPATQRVVWSARKPGDDVVQTQSDLCDEHTQCAYEVCRKLGQDCDSWPL